MADRGAADVTGAADGIKMQGSVSRSMLELPTRRRWRDELDALFGIDLRSLALFRIALAAAVLVDLAGRSTDLVAHYTDAGVLPRAALIGRFSTPWQVSLHLASGVAPIQAILLLLHALAAGALLIGWRTHRATLATWALLTWLHVRNPMVLQGSDVLLRLLLFWGLFLPLGAVYSVDRALNPDPRPLPKRICWPASAALLLQAPIMYVFSAIQKTGADWHNGTAIANALQIDHFATPLGVRLARWDGALRPLTYAVLWLERLAPWLLFCPVGRRWLRPAALVALTALQIGFALGLELGPFPWITTIGLIPFLPSEWWDAQLARLRTPVRTGLRIYYDRDCGFCRKSVLLIRTLLLLPETPILPAQDDAAVNAVMEAKHSWVVVDHEGRSHIRFAALLAILRASPVAWWMAPILGWPPIAAVGGAVYRWIADHRPLAATFLTPFKPHRLTVRPSLLGQALATVALAYTLWWNLTTLPNASIRIPRSLRWIGPLTQLSQRWDMFAPSPMRSDGWFVLPATLDDGRVVDLMRGGEPVTWEKPALVSAMYPNFRWRKYMVNLHKKTYAAHRRLFLRYVCRAWNADAPPGSRAREVQLVYMREDTPEPGQSATVKRVDLLREPCGDDPR